MVGRCDCGKIVQFCMLVIGYPCTIMMMLVVMGVVAIMVVGQIDILNIIGQLLMLTLVLLLLIKCRCYVMFVEEKFEQYQQMNRTMIIMS